MTEKRPGPAPGVRLIEVSVKRELTVDRKKKIESIVLNDSKMLVIIIRCEAS